MFNHRFAFKYDQKFEIDKKPLGWFKLNFF